MSQPRAQQPPRAYLEHHLHTPHQFWRRPAPQSARPVPSWEHCPERQREQRSLSFYGISFPLITHFYSLSLMLFMYHLSLSLFVFAPPPRGPTSMVSHEYRCRTVHSRSMRRAVNNFFPLGHHRIPTARSTPTARHRYVVFVARHYGVLSIRPTPTASAGHRRRSDRPLPPPPAVTAEIRAAECRSVRPTRKRRPVPQVPHYSVSPSHTTLPGNTRHDGRLPRARFRSTVLAACSDVS